MPWARLLQRSGGAPALLTHRVDGPAGAPAVLLLNGGMMSISAWDEVAAALVDRYRVVRCDFRGQLMTPGLPPPELAAHVADVVALLDNVGLAKAHVVATSFGGGVALLLSARHPGRVASLVAATVVDVAPPSMLAIGARLAEAGERAIAAGDGRPYFELLSRVVYSPAYLEAMAGALARRAEMLAALPAAWYEGATRLLAALGSADLSGELPRIACPTLVIAAGLDALMPMERTAAVARAIPGARLEVVEGSGHALVVERRERFVELVAGFLAAVTVNPGSVVRSP